MTTTRIMVRATAIAALTLSPPLSVRAQDANVRARVDSLVLAGDLAAHDSKPVAAIAAYEQAIALDGTRRRTLLPRLGRQYLWSDRPHEATRLFKDYLAVNRGACETQLDLGLALSWANELDEARVTYDDVAAHCLYERGAARLGGGTAPSWPTAATGIASRQRSDAPTFASRVRSRGPRSRSRIRSSPPDRAIRRSSRRG
jgi:hypothetical protein